MNTLRLVPEDGGAAIEITGDHTQVGRDPGSDVHLRNASVSRQHAVIEKNADEWVITDRKSGNGVLIDGERTSVGVLLPGQLLQLGTVRFRVEIDRGDDGATVILGRSPLLDTEATFIGPGPFEGPPGVGGSGRSGRGPGRFPVLVALVGVVVIALLGLFLLSNRSSSPKADESVAPVAPAPTVAPPTPTPEPPTPTPTPARRAPSRPRASLLISTDTQADLFVDGRRIGRLGAGRMRSVQVSPGEHIVSFRIGKTRHDRLARVKAREQAVVRYRRAGPPPTPSPAPAAPDDSSGSTPTPAPTPAKSR